MTYLRYALCAAIYWLLLSSSAHADFFKSKNGLDCAPSPEMKKFLLQKMELGYSSTFEEDNGYIMSLYFSRQSGIWAITGYLDDGSECIITKGYGYWPIRERKA